MAAVLVAAMLAVRSQLSPATTALVLVIPVVVAVSVGGFVAGIFATAICFVGYDFWFLPPYYTLYVAHLQDWLALGVYGVVMVVVSRLVAGANAARERAARREREVRRLFDVSELLVRELPERQLLDAIVTSVCSGFDLDGVSLLLPRDGALRVVASAGAAFADQPDALFAESPVASRTGPCVDRGGYQAVALAASGRPVGLLTVKGASGDEDAQERLRAFANHLALALERSQLREEAMRARLLEETDKLRRSLIGAVSHDLRTPLATIKVSASALVDSAGSLTASEQNELAELVDAQADRLDRLVSNILDMTRIQAGTLQLRRRPVPVSQLVDEAMAVLARSARPGDLRWRAPAGLPLVDVDPMLVRQVLANLLDNAFRHSPPGSPVTVLARVPNACAGGRVEVRVTDSGPGIPDGALPGLFTMSELREAGGRGGLGLTIVEAFVEAHGGSVRAEPGPGGRFVFTLPAAPQPQAP